MSCSYIPLSTAFSIVSEANQQSALTIVIHMRRGDVFKRCKPIERPCMLSFYAQKDLETGHS
jgi:hypothetical protein